MHTVLSTVANGALVLKHQGISNHSADWIFIVLNQFHTEMLQLFWYQYQKIKFLKKLPSCFRIQPQMYSPSLYLYPRFNEVERGVYWYHLVCLSVCGQNRVRSVSSTILIGSISYLHILSSNFRRCVACNAGFKIQKFKILVNFLNL